MDLSVAELKQQIDTEYKAAKLGLVGLSSGTSRHTVITAKMERMNETREKLQTLVGDSAIGIIANVIDQYQINYLEMIFCLLYEMNFITQWKRNILLIGLPTCGKRKI